MSRDLERSPLECVDPSVGGRLAELERPDLDAPTRAQIEAHVSVCDACRELLDLNRRVGSLAEAGRLPRPVPARGAVRPLVPLTAVAWAASLAALVLLPPQPPGDLPAVRGGELRFLRPVEGEVVPAGGLDLRWTELDGVAKYVVELYDENGRVAWEGASAVPRLDVRAGELPARGEYRALLSVRPADLAGPVPASVAFRTASWPTVLANRAVHAHPWRQGLVVLMSALVLGTGLFARRARAGGGDRFRGG